MAVKSVYLSEVVVEGGVIRITADEHHHLTVARSGEKEPIEIFDGQGRVWSAVIESVGRRETSARVTGERKVEPDPHEVILGQALIRSAAFELALEKAVEVGVTRIIPFTAARSNVPPAHRADRWKRIIVEAAKQSKRYWLPRIDEPMPFEKVLRLEASSKILFAERGGGSLKPALQGSPVLYLVGPEGGWTDAELKAAQDHGFELVGLGAGILRSETAAIVGGALIRYALTAD
jgi:16S rRNA (uracil1498-N3)-methyltransferase